MKKAQKAIQLIRLIPRLGPLNIGQVALHKIKVSLGWRPATISRPCPPGNFFAESTNNKPLSPINETLFGWKTHEIINIPDWHIDPFNPTIRLDPHKDSLDLLQELKDTDAKHFWELSRFYWAPRFALASRHSDPARLTTLNAWLSNWVDSNTPNHGINWACGQEAAIRLMHLLLTALILDEWEQPSAPLVWLIEAHVTRILSTFYYSIGQDNNHGSAESCALFIAGTWGARWGMANASKIRDLGHYWINNRALRLIQADGSPCQYSVTYHRANIEAFSLAQFWCDKIRIKGFSDIARARVILGTRWLHQITDPLTGDAPNLGANDGSHLFNFCQAPYRDFRPTISFAARIFTSSSAYTNFLDPRLAILGITANDGPKWAYPSSSIHDDGGFQVVRSGQLMAMFRYPRFRFRPSQCDSLHLDVWLAGVNLLRDAGTYSYVSTSNSIHKFDGTAFHNTIQFDGRDQMPRIGRFLFGNWLTTAKLNTCQHDGTDFKFGASYTDGYGATHERNIALSQRAIAIADRIYGFKKFAIIRWRIPHGKWSVKKDRNTYQVSSNEHPGVILTLNASMHILRCHINEGYESHHYMSKTPITVVEAEVSEAGLLTTRLLLLDGVQNAFNTH